LNVGLRTKKFERMEKAHVEWVQCPTDLDAVNAMINAGLIDVAMTLSEDAAVQLSNSSSLRVCGVLEGLPRKWSLLMPFCYPFDGPGTMRINRLAIPSGFGGKLVAGMMLEKISDTGSEIQQLEYPCLLDALCDLIKVGSVQAVLWELSAQEKSVLSASQFNGLYHIALEMNMPWPSHLFLTSRDTLRAKSCTIRHFLCYCNRVAADFVLDVTGESVEYLVERYEMTNDEAINFLATASWHFSFEAHEGMFASLFACLQRLKIMSANSEAALRRYLNHGGRVTTMPAAAKPWWAHDMIVQAQENTRVQDAAAAPRPRVATAQVSGHTYDIDETSEGAAPLPLSGPRSHRLIPALGPSSRGPSSMFGRSHNTTCVAKESSETSSIGKCNILHAMEALAPVAPPDSPVTDCRLSPRAQPPAPFTPSLGGCFILGDIEGEPVPAG
jgi:hypothetical protein